MKNLTQRFDTELAYFNLEYHPVSLYTRLRDIGLPKEVSMNSLMKYEREIYSEVKRELEKEFFKK